jgi:hypothetical protein
MWVVESLPANREWTKTVATKEEAAAVLREHICEQCLTEEMPWADMPKPNPASVEDLLSTMCGCDFSVYEMKEVAA